MQGKLQSLTPEQRNAVEALTRGLINKVLHQPLQALKSAARAGDQTIADAVQQIFGLNGGLTTAGEETAAVVDAPPAEETTPEAVEASRR
jgi:glutamyl-tRNA reductase